MRIAMIHLTGNGFPPDIRIEKEIRVLAAAGHAVTICTKSTSKHPETWETHAPGVEIFRLPVGGPPSWAAKRAANFTLRESWVRAAVESFLDKTAPDVVHVHDFPYLPLVLDCAEPRGLPVVADLHENMPAAKRAWRSNLSPYRRLKAAVLFNYPLWRWHERRALHRCARVIVVVPESADRFDGYGLPRDKVVIVSNTEDATTFDFPRNQADADVLARYADRWMVSYIGGIGPHRGWDTAMAGVARARRDIPDLTLAIVGAGEENARMLQARAEELDIADIVDIIPWQPFQMVNSYMHASRVCLVPHRDFEHTHTTVPHKLFQNMICAKPVLVSDCRPLKRIVEDAECGLVFRADDAADFADRLTALHGAAPETLEEMGTRGREAALGRYAWRHDAERLVELYRMLGEELG